MVWAQEMKNLVGDIKTSHRDRTTKISQIKGDTQNILKEADEHMKRVNAELREMAKNLKDFLADSQAAVKKNEETRKKDFEAMMGEIQVRVKDIKEDVKDLLSKSEETRIAEFKTLMGDIKESLSSLRRRVGEVRRDAKGTLGHYKAERKEAAGYWGALSGKRFASAAEEEKKEEEEEKEEEEKEEAEKEEAENKEKKKKK